MLTLKLKYHRKVQNRNEKMAKQASEMHNLYKVMNW